MLKRSIKTFILCFVLSIMCVLNVNAASIENVVEPGDIIIGNTVFRSDDWISATRSSKAGALYSTNTGSTDVRVFYYDDFEDWYEYNDETSKYELITEPTLSELGNMIDIYYDNNEPLLNTYISISDTEYDEETGETYPIENDVGNFYNNLARFAEIMMNDDEVELDYENETITCPYGKTFEFQVVFNDESTDYVGYCGLEDFEFIGKEDFTMEKLQIDNIEISKEPSLLNQSKVSFKKDFPNELTINERLKTISIEPYGHPGEANPIFEGNFVALDINFIENNSCYSYSLTLTGSIYGPYYYSCIDKNTMRLYLDLNSYNGAFYNFTLLDSNYSTYENMFLSIKPLTRPSYDVSLKDIDIVSSDIVSNNSLIVNHERKDEVIDGDEYNYIFVNTIGEIQETSILDNVPGKWIAIDFILNDEFNYDSARIEHNFYADNYEILEDRIRFYFDMNNLDERHISILDEDTSSVNSQINYSVVLNNYTEDYSLENYDKTFNGVYYATTNDTNDGILIEKANAISGRYSDVFVYDNTLYVKADSSEIIFMEDNQLKKINITKDEEQSGNQIININPYEMEIVISNGTQEGCEWKRSPEVINGGNGLYDTVMAYLNEKDESYNAYVYKFFSPDRILTPEEQAEFDKLANPEGNPELSQRIHIVDISDSVYATE